MNTTRLLAFFAAVLITAILFRAVTYDPTIPQQTATATAARAQSTAGAQSTAD